jgi:sensor histidine kinase YesM
MEGRINILFDSRYRIAWHILFWMGAVVFLTLFFGHQQKEYAYTIFFVGILLPITMLTTYLIFYYLIPRFLVGRKYVGFISRTLFTILFSFYLGTMAIFMMLFFFIYRDGPQMDATTVDVYFLAVGMYFVVLIAVVIKLFKLWYEKQQKERMLEKEKLQAELNMLKSQIHPHFLFNTLNNIYSLALQKSDAAPEMLVRLSEILHYILYECKGQRVPLEKEITLLNNYIELEKIRYDQRLELTWKMPENTPSIELAPMILLPFVENAFKHGASKMRKKALIDMKLSINDHVLDFRIKNNMPARSNKEGGAERHGIGLANVRQRLELTYPGKHTLDIHETGEEFIVHLVVDTSPSSSTI